MRSLFYKLLAVLAVSDVVFILSSGFFTVKQGRDSQEKKLIEKLIEMEF